MPRPLHPVHAIFLAGALPLTLGALLADLAYAASFETQWKNFASWLVVGAVAFSGIAAVWAVVDLVRIAVDRGARRLVYVVAIVAATLLGIANSFVHAGDAWQSMPTGAVVSGIVVVLTLAAIAIGFSNARGESRT